MLDELRVVLSGEFIEKVTRGKSSRPHRPVVGKDFVSSLRQSLRDPSSSREAVQNTPRANLGYECQNLRQELELGPCVFDTLSGWGIQIRIIK
jgi:hypothetical protein